jgi:AraC family transcriptional regulator
MKTDATDTLTLPSTRVFQLVITNMVCPRCISAVEAKLSALGLQVHRIVLGEVEVSVPGGAEPDWTLLKVVLQNAGFDLVDDPRLQLVERIKALIVNMIHYLPAGTCEVNYSDYLVRHLDRDYHYLAHQFSTQEGINIEKFIIRQKVERAKELLGYGELNIAQVAHELGYSSQAHLARQFRQVTGVSPSEYQQLGPDGQGRRFLDDLA